MNPSATGAQPRMKTPKFSGDKIQKGFKAGQLQQYTPEQLQLLEQTMGHVGPESYLSRLSQGDEDLFNEMEAPALRQFNQILGGIGTRFSAGSGAGSLGTRRSSGFQNTGTAAASNFAQELQSKRQDLMRQAIKDLTGISSELLDKRPYERTITEKPKKWWEEPLAGFTNAFANQAGKNLAGSFGGGGGDGASQGAQLAMGA